MYMAWNEPGGDNRDPWGGKGGNEGPPDLDELVRKLRDGMNRLFSRRGGRGAGASSGNPISFGFIIGLAVALWVLSGIYIIDPAERGVVLQLGKFKEITGPGPHWIMRFIETVEKVNIDRVRTVSHKAQILTKDENIIQVELAVQYQVKDPKDYLFKVREPDLTLQEATESAMREVIGSITMDKFLSGGRGELVSQTKELLQTMLDRYQTGLMLTSVNLLDPQPPEEVQGAFQDAIKAQEDEVRYKNEAEAYARDIVPKARGDAKRMREEAGAYKDQSIARAQGETSRFLQTLKEYKKAPEITRKRLYLDTMEEVLASTSKVIIDVKGGNNLMYLPLDKLMQSSSDSTRQAQEESQSGASARSRSPEPVRRRSTIRQGDR
jgi:membrane protease subunit HflK